MAHARFTHRWQGEENAEQEFGTDAWLEIDDEKIDLELLLAQQRWPIPVNECDTCDDMPIPGVLLGMNDEFGIERCDECEVFPGDLAAAMAAATQLFTPPAEVWFEGRFG